jgi:predicted ribosome quality control (RQC) complex YloA/Tae2 family protein
MDGLSLSKVVLYLKSLENLIVKRLLVDNGIISIAILSNSGNTGIIFDTKKGDIYFDKSDEGKDFFNKINGAKIVSIHQRGYDRVFYLKLARSRRSGVWEYFKLVFEVVGGNSNLFVLDEKNTILISANGKNIDPDRIIKPGATYTPFKSNKMLTLNNIMHGKEIDFNHVEGFYKKTALFANNIHRENGFNMEKTLYTLKSYLTDGLFYLDENKKFYPFPIYERMETIKVEDYRGSHIVANRSEVSQFAKIIGEKISKKEALLVKLRDELMDAFKFDTYIQKADLLKSNLYRIDEALSTNTMYLFSKEGVTSIHMEIRENNIESYIDKLYKKGKKLQRSIPLLEKRINEIKNEVLFLKEMSFFIDKNAVTPEEVRLILFKKGQNNNSHLSRKSHRYLSYKKGNSTIFVGKNSIGNEEILKLSDKNDLWFHVQGYPSSHVILKHNNGFDEASLLEACQITAYYSKIANEDKVPVDYTTRKYVRKIKGSPAGFVIYDNFKTMVVRPASPESLGYALIGS